MFNLSVIAFIIVNSTFIPPGGFKPPLTTGYGMTETTCVSTTQPTLNFKYGTIGKLLSNTEAKVLLTQSQLFLYYFIFCRTYRPSS